jgi:Ubiquitin family
MLTIPNPTVPLLHPTQHDDDEYGATVTGEGRLKRHSGGPFTVTVSPKMRIDELRCVIRDVGGVLPALQRLSYAGKRLEDPVRTLEMYGIAYWHAKFPHWPIKIRCN